MIGSSDYTNNPSPQLSPLWFSFPQTSMTTSLQQSDDDLQNPVQQDKHSSIFSWKYHSKIPFAFFISLSYWLLFSPTHSLPKCWILREPQKWTLIGKEKGIYVAGKTGTSSLWASHLANRDHYALQNYSGSHLKTWLTLSRCQNFLLIYRQSLGWLCSWIGLFRLDT